MCMLAVLYPGAIGPTRKQFHAAFVNNHDGGGMAYAENGKLIIAKGFFNCRNFWKAYRTARKRVGSTSAIMLHFRFATEGVTSAENCHPFSMAGGNVAFAHNGILLEFNPQDTRSDTAFFADTVLAHRTAEQLMSEEFGEWLADIIGIFNKVALLDNTGRCKIINHAAGNWSWDGTWYSNYSYRPMQPCSSGQTLGTIFRKQYGPYADDSVEFEGGVNRGLTFDDSTDNANLEDSENIFWDLDELDEAKWCEAFKASNREL